MTLCRTISLYLSLILLAGLLSSCVSPSKPAPPEGTGGAWGLPNEPRFRTTPGHDDRQAPPPDIESRPQPTPAPQQKPPQTFYEPRVEEPVERPAKPGFTHVLNFEEAPLEKVVRVFADMLGITIVMDPTVKGSVTLQSGAEIRDQDLMPLLETILELNQAALIRDGAIYRVVPLAGAKKSPGMLRMDLPGRDDLMPEGFGLQVYYLGYISAPDAAKVLKPFVGAGGEVLAVVPANAVIVADSAKKLDKISQLIQMLDRPLSQRVLIKLYPVKNVDVTTLSKEMAAIFQAMAIPNKPTAGVWADLVPLPELSSIAVISTFPETFGMVEQWMLDLDRQISGAEMGVFVYYCQHGDATNIADVLAGLYGASSSGGTSTGGRQTSKTKAGTPGSLPGSTRPGSSSSSSNYNYSGLSGLSGTGTVTTGREASAVRAELPESPQAGPARETEEGIRFVVDVANNAIVLRSPRAKLQDLLRTIRKLDVYPKQVLIEVMIAEIELDQGMNLGVEWTTLGNPSDSTFTLGSLSHPASFIPGSGLVYAITRTNQITATLRALAADRKVNILSSPILLAAENVESRINVGSEVPTITTVTTSQNLEDARQVVDRSIQYRDTGIILSVIPKINNSGLVRLAIDQELTDISEAAFGNTDSPSFFKRSATTNVITVDGQTVVIGGLIKSEITDRESGVPFFKDIPLLGYLFKAREKTIQRTELIISLTPHVIHNMQDAQALVSNFNEQLRALQEKHTPTYPWYREKADPQEGVIQLPAPKTVQERGPQ